MLTPPIPPANKAPLSYPFASDEECSEHYRHQEIERINPALHSLTWEQQTEVVFAVKVIENAGHKFGTEDWKNQKRDQESANIAERILARYGLTTTGQRMEQKS